MACMQGLLIQRLGASLPHDASLSALWNSAWCDPNTASLKQRSDSRSFSHDKLVQGPTCRFFSRFSGCVVCTHTTVEPYALYRRPPLVRVDGHAERSVLLSKRCPAGSQETSERQVVGQCWVQFSNVKKRQRKETQKSGSEKLNEPKRGQLAQALPHGRLDWSKSVTPYKCTQMTQ